MTDGPFPETKEVLGGYWIIEVGSKKEAVDWAARCPAGDNETIEVRQLQEMSDFPDDVKKVVAKYPEVVARYPEVQGKGPEKQASASKRRAQS